MPTFEVMIEDVFDRTVEETWRSYESLHVTRTLRVDAEDEEEAEELARDGYGDVINEEEYSDSYDSEHWSTGDIIHEEHTGEINVTVRPPRPPQQGGIVRARAASGLGWIPSYQPREPDWEV